MPGAELILDLTHLVAGAGGLGDAALDRHADAAAAAFDATMARREAGEIGFLDLPESQRAAARAAMDFARDLPPEIDTMVVCGIGGSSLGPRAVYSALARPFDPLRPRSPGMPRRLFFPDNVDPETFAGLLAAVDLETTVFDVVTKSGGTAETAAQLQVVFDRLSTKLGEGAPARHLIATTDPERGALRAAARSLGLTAFDIPGNVGGRFSVLTPVGLVPAAVAGLDVMGLLDGAARMRDACASRDVRDNPALLLATLLWAHHGERGRPMTVVMSYADALYDVADWFRQLWAESLGKALDTDGNEVHVGPTPIAARGATDQHSQLQLYAEGPDDKVYLFLTPRERAVELTIPRTPLADDATYGYLAGRGMGELLDAELRGTAASLTRRGRPSGTIALERVTAAAVGELFMLLELTTAFAGPLYRVDPFDQPGVEEAKRLAYAALGRDGFDAERAVLEQAPPADPRYVFGA